MFHGWRSLWSRLGGSGDAASALAPPDHLRLHRRHLRVAAGRRERLVEARGHHRRPHVRDPEREHLLDRRLELALQPPVLDERIDQRVDPGVALAERRSRRRAAAATPARRRPRSASAPARAPRARARGRAAPRTPCPAPASFIHTGPERVGARSTVAHGRTRTSSTSPVRSTCASIHATAAVSIMRCPGVDPSSMRARLRDPTWWTNALQIVKTVVAAVIAWVLAVYVFDIEQAFLAPWAALLTVHATVYRTFRRGAQQVGATVLGVLVAFALGSLLGLNALSLGLTILVALVAGSVRGLRAESTTAAATALVVLTTGASDEAGALLTRLADTGIGIAVGLLVNLLVWPPLRDRSAAAQVDAIDDRLGELLSEIAATLRGSVGEEDVDGWIDPHQRARRRHRAGVGRRAPGARERQPQPAPRRARPHAARPRTTTRLLERLEQAVAEHPQHGPHDLARERPARALGPGASARPGSTCSNARARRSATPIADELERCATTSTRSRRALRRRAAGRLLARRRRAARQPPQHPRRRSTWSPTPSPSRCPRRRSPAVTPACGRGCRRR